MTIYAYLFEAKNIQSYILATNRLKEIVGASELIESLTGAMLDDAIDKAGPNIKWSRRGSGALYLFSSNANSMQRFAALWPLIVRQYAPDLEFIQAQAQANTDKQAYAQAHSQLLVARNVPVARLPQATPVVERNRRTGEPAVELIKPGEPVDAATFRKLNKKFWHSIELAKRFAPRSVWAAWPVNFALSEVDAADEKFFPFIGTDRNLALVYADCNNLSQWLINLGATVDKQVDQYVELYRFFVETVTKATQQAVQIATEQVLLPNQRNGVYPARPIVLDTGTVTILVRSDLALEFTRCFLTQFAIYTGIFVQEFKQKFNLPQFPNRFTACAGVAYARVNQPLYLLNGLAIGLCNHAKRLAKAQDKDNVPTTLSLHHVTNYFINDYGTILERELTSGNLRQTLECYALEPNQGLPVLDNLLQLRELMSVRNMSQNSVRELLGIVGTNPTHALYRYRRWREIMNERATARLQIFDNLLFELGITGASGDLPYSGSATSKLRSTPLGDVIALQAVGDICKANV